MAPGIFLGAFVSIFSFFAHAQVDELSRDPQWLNMVHYKKSWWSYVGQADGEKFYLSQDGKTDPKAELQETLDQFRQGKAVCRFPARYNWLKTKFNELTLDPMKECSEYRDFVSKVNAKSVSLIFSSYFINSPASAFGHTFLRVNSSPHRNDDQDQAELLDYGINFAAVMDTSNVLVYATKSMLGLFPGTFTAVPYYYKVREYNDFESRDLWEYKLNFNQSQIDRMVDHMWELGPTYFDYKFFTENCSYHVLGVLEVGNPELHVTDKLPSLYVIPIDTIRVAVEEPGLVVGSRYRPSVLSRLEYRTKDYSIDELNIVRSMEEKPEQVEFFLGKDLTAEKRAEYLDTAIDAFDFLHAKELVYEPKKANEKRHHLLTERALTDYVSKPLQMTPGNDFLPENGHRSQRWGMFGGYKDGQGAFATASMRFALHDLLDPLPGQPTFSEIHFAGITGRLQQTEYSDSKKLYLDNLDIFRVSSFQPITPWQNSMSWTAKLGMRTVQDDACNQCLAGTLEAGGGASIGPAKSESFVALLSKFELDYSSKFSTNWRTAIGPEVWGRWVPSKKWSWLAIVGYKWSNYLEQPLFADQIFTHSLEGRYHASKEYSFALKGEGQESKGHAISLGFYRFF